MRTPRERADTIDDAVGVHVQPPKQRAGWRRVQDDRPGFPEPIPPARRTPAENQKMMVENKLKPGARFRMSPLGAARCPNLAGRTGTVVQVFRTKSAFRVLVDGTK